MTQAPTPGPLDDASTRLLRSGDWIRFKNDPPVQVSSNDVTCGSPHWSFIGRPDADGWMPWSGGENPVPGRRVEVKIRWRNGVPSEWPVESDVMRWKHRRGLDEGGDIIAFRLAPTAPVEASGSEREHGPKCWGKTSISDEMMYCYCGSTDSPPGETREALDRLKMAAHVYEDDEMAADCATLEALLSARPLTLGGQKGNSETLRVLLDNLVIAQTLSKDIRQKATDEARSYLYDLRHTPQPSGETREAVADLWQELCERDDRTSPDEYPEMCLITFDELSDFIARGATVASPMSIDAAMSEIADIMTEASISEPAGRGAGYDIDYNENAIRAILALLSARPLALGGQQGEVESAWLKAEAQLSEISAAIGSARFMDPPDGGSVTLSEQVQRMRLALEEAEAALSTTPARAEAQDEGSAGEPVAWFRRDPRTGRINHLGLNNPNGGYQPLYAHPSPTPAADADRVRIVVEPVARVELTNGRWNILWLGGNAPDGTLLYLQPAPDDLRKDAERYCFLRSRDPGPDGKLPSAGPFIGQVPENYILTGRDADNAIDQALAALKSTAAKEGGE